MVFISDMKAVHIRDLDLNLLVLAEVIYRHRNLSSAAEELSLTPSAVSHALSRLTAYYGAPLFVRASRGVVPTQLGLRLESEIRSFRDAAQRVIERDTGFDPGKVEGRLYIATTEFFEMTVGPELITMVRNLAPGVQLCFLDLLGAHSYRALETGQIDLAVAGQFPSLPTGLSQRRLFRDEFETLAGGKLPRDRPLTQKEYLAAEHILITLTGDLHGKVDAVLEGKGLRRRVVLATTSFATPLWLLRDRDLVLTAPRLLLRCYGEVLRWQAQVCPVEVPPVEIKMIWHQRTQKDPLRQWLRDCIAEISRAL